MLKKYFAIATLILSFVFVVAWFVNKSNLNIVNAQKIQTSPVDSNRDLSSYEIGKTYDFSWSKIKTMRKERDEFREFLWKHWLEKRLAKITATFYSIEGDPTTSTYYIEPDKNGQWNVFVESVSECCWTYARQNPKKERERVKSTNTYSNVERVQAVNDRNGVFLKWKTVPIEKQILAKDYMLRLNIDENAPSPNVF